MLLSIGWRKDEKYMKKKQTIPKVTYQYVEFEDGERRLAAAYKIIFDAVWESQDWNDNGKNTDLQKQEKPLT